MKQKIDLETWEWREYYEFYRNFFDPYHGYTVQIDFTDTYRFAKDNNLSVFLCMEHRLLKAINSVTALRLRIEGNDVVLYDTIHGGGTIGRPDGTFGFAFTTYYDDVRRYVREGEKEVERVRNSKGLCATPENQTRTDVVYTSVMPWFNPTSAKHAYSGQSSSIPYFTIGQLVDEDDRKKASISLYANHALVSGKDMGDFFRILNEINLQ